MRREKIWRRKKNVNPVNNSVFILTLLFACLFNSHCYSVYVRQKCLEVYLMHKHLFIQVHTYTFNIIDAKVDWSIRDWIGVIWNILNNVLHSNYIFKRIRSLGLYIYIVEASYGMIHHEFFHFCLIFDLDFLQTLFAQTEYSQEQQHEILLQVEKHRLRTNKLQFVLIKNHSWMSYAPDNYRCFVFHKKKEKINAILLKQKTIACASRS